ncbi:MAG TPA: bifunctional DNA-formamidopyrimidine glycosylase/DNA-(apurinic or apyrimidinic site) lyase [Longimicrobiales bacterium]|nr:bifunctional DNA-formamidopyrimidine glycosylase/DNA-(apurinic or apyrimidinic site) lyase [Longimicrobiales bacterium]
MPELPEAETIVRDLQRKVVGRTITGTKVIFPDILGTDLTPRRLSRLVKDHTITLVERRAKKIVLRLSKDLVLVISLGMTGRVVVSRAQRARELRHIAVHFQLDDGSALLYDDARRFGSIEVYSTERWQERQVSLGVEPLSDEFTAALLFAMTRNSITPMRNWLLDQKRVSGVGNIYASEALFRAGVRPTRRALTLTRAEAARLRETMRAVLNASIDARGTTLSDYRDAQGMEGGFEPLLQVYDRAGQPCLRCGTPIKRVVFTNRSAFYCPQCQK